MGRHRPGRLLRQTRHWAIPTIALVNVWRHMGYTALLIFAGLQTIPATCTRRPPWTVRPSGETFWRITMPLLRPVLVLVLVITVVGSFQMFDTVAVTTDGGPVNASRVIQVYIIERAFDRSDFGYAAAHVRRAVPDPRRRRRRADQTAARRRVGPGLRSQTT